MTDTTTLPAASSGRSLWADALARLRANKAAMIGAGYLVLMALLCVFGPFFTPNDSTKINQHYTSVPPRLPAYHTHDINQPSL